MSLLTKTHLLLRDIEAMGVPHEMHRSGYPLDQIAMWLKTRQREDAQIANAGMRKRAIHAHLHVGTDSVVVLLTDSITLHTIEELTHPDPRQQVGLSLALRWGRKHKRTLTFI